MSDHDREAFEADCQRREVYTGRHHDFSEQYRLYETQLRWMGWQAAREHYSPALTEKEAVEAAARAIDATAKEDFRGGIEYNAAAFAKAALRAAGIRFGEEA